MKSVSSVSKMSVTFLSIFCLFLLAGCGGGGNGSSTPPSANSGPAQIVPITPTDPGTTPTIPVTPTPTPAPVTTPVPTVPTPLVNGTIAHEVTIGTTKFVSYVRNNDVYLISFAQDGTPSHEEPILVTADTDHCESMLAMNGFLYLECVQSAPGFYSTGSVYVIKVDVATNRKVATFNIVTLGTPIAFIAEATSATLYVSYSDANAGGVDTLVRIAADGTKLNSVTDNPSGSGEEFYSPIVIGSDGIFVTSIRMQNGQNNRVHVIKYSFDLNSRMATTVTDEYRPFSAAGMDNPTGAKLSADGKTLIVSASVGIGGPTPQTVSIDFDATTLKFLNVTILPGNGV